MCSAPQQLDGEEGAGCTAGQGWLRPQHGHRDHEMAGGWDAAAHRRCPCPLRASGLSVSRPPPSGLTPGVSLCPPTAQAVAALPGAVDEALSILTFLLDSCVQNGLVQEVDLQRVEQSGRKAPQLPLAPHPTPHGCMGTELWGCVPSADRKACLAYRHGNVRAERALTWYLFLHAAFSAERNLSSSVVQLK